MKKSHALFAFVGLIVLLTAGAAQSLSGTNTVDSGDIIDGQVKFADIKPDAVTQSRIRTNGVASSEVKDNSLTGTDIDEETLTAPTGEADDENGACFGDSGPETCSTASITLAKPGTVLITATYEWNSDNSAQVGPQSGIVKLVVDGTTVETANPGDNVHDNSVEYPQPVIELLPLAAGTHQIKLTFEEVNAAADVDVRGSHIVAVRVAS